MNCLVSFMLGDWIPLRSNPLTLTHHDDYDYMAYGYVMAIIMLSKKYLSRFFLPIKFTKLSRESHWLALCTVISRVFTHNIKKSILKQASPFCNKIKNKSQFSMELWNSIKKLQERKRIELCDSFFLHSISILLATEKES